MFPRPAGLHGNLQPGRNWTRLHWAVTDRLNAIQKMATEVGKNRNRKRDPHACPQSIRSTLSLARGQLKENVILRSTTLRGRGPGIAAGRSSALRFAATTKAPRYGHHAPAMRSERARKSRCAPRACDLSSLRHVPHTPLFDVMPFGGAGLPYHASAVSPTRTILHHLPLAPAVPETVSQSRREIGLFVGETGKSPYSATRTGQYNKTTRAAAGRDVPGSADGPAAPAWACRSSVTCSRAKGCHACTRPPLKPW